MTDQGLMIVLSAPSGTGKSSICRKVLAASPMMEFSVSYTSRMPRPNEVDGKDYHFISRGDFQRRIDQGEFVEWIENYANFYGTSVKATQEVLRKGKDLLMDIEPRGARAIKKSSRMPCLCLYCPPPWRNF